MEERIRLEVSTHSGTSDIIYVDDYNANEMVTKLNDLEIQAVIVGDHIYSRIDVKNIKPVSEGSEENSE